MTNAEARFNNSLRPRKPEGSLGRTAQDVHLDSHTAPERYDFSLSLFYHLFRFIYHCHYHFAQLYMTIYKDKRSHVTIW